MAKERVATSRNTGTESAPIWEIWFAKTVADAVMMSDSDSESVNIKQYVDKKIADLIGGAPETFDTLKEIADYIASHTDVVNALNDAIANKANKFHAHALASASEDGFMAKANFSKLAGIAASANNYTHPSSDGNKHVPANGTTNNNKFLKATATAGSCTWEDLTKTTVGLSNVDNTSDANKPISIAVKNALTSHTHALASASADGFMAKADFSKLAGIAASANNYTHPSSHPASIITQDTTHRFVSDTEKTTWNDKYTKNEINNKFSTLETNIDWKEAVDTYNDIATTYTNPQDGWTVVARDTDMTWRYNGTKWISISANSIPMATETLDGLMSKDNFNKLASIDTKANNYTHPFSHPASIITQDTTHRFVSDTEKTTWNDKANIMFASTAPSSAPAGTLLFLTA